MSLNSKSALGKPFAVFEYEGIREWLSAHITAHGLQDVCSACHLAFEDAYRRNCLLGGNKQEEP